MRHLCSPLRCALVLIDMQERLMPAMHEGDAAIAQAAILGDAAGRLAVPVIASSQYPRGLGATVNAIEPLCDRIVEKTAFAATAAPEFMAALSPASDQIVLAGCEAHVCVLQTALGLLERGYDVRIVADAVASRTTRSRDLALQRARDAGAVVVTTEMVLFEWLGDATHPEFKTLSKRIK